MSKKKNQKSNLSPHSHEAVHMHRSSSPNPAAALHIFADNEQACMALPTPRILGLI
jgi:hypothetical protein